MSKILKGLNEVNSHNYDSDWDYQDAVARSGKSRSSYSSPKDDTFDDDVAYSRKMYQLGQQQKAAKEKAQRDSDHDRLASGTNEGDDNIQTRMRMDDYYNLADAIQEKLRQAIQMGDNELVHKLSKKRADLDARVKKYGLMPESEQLDELDTKLGLYKIAAGKDATAADKAGDYKRGHKRFKGITTATKKEFANDAKQPVKEDINVVYRKAKSLLTQLDENTQQRVINALTKSVVKEFEGDIETITAPTSNNEPSRGFAIKVTGTLGFSPRLNSISAVTLWQGLSAVFPDKYPVKDYQNPGAQLDSPQAKVLNQIRRAGSAVVASGIASRDLAETLAHKLATYKPTSTDYPGIGPIGKQSVEVIEQGMDESTQQPVEPFKTGYPRVSNPQILGTQNKAKSIYHPPSKPNVKKLDKPLPENLGNELKSKSLKALQQVKQQLEQQRMADLEQWEKDFKQNTVSKFTAREPNLNQRATSTSMVAMPGEKHSELKTRLGQLDKVIEKQGILDKMVQRLDKKGLLTPNIEAGVDTSMLARDGARDNYVELNRKLDKALEYVKNRLLTNKTAYAKPKGVDEGWSQKYKSSINCSHPKGFSQKAHCAGKKKHNESIEMEMVCEDCGMCETHVDHENLDEACWKGYHKDGMKTMFGKEYPNCKKNKKKKANEDVMGSLNELSVDLLQKAAQVAKDKREQAMNPKVHNALGGGYMNPLAKHYDAVNQKLSNRAVKVGIRDKVSKIASPALMRKMELEDIEEDNARVARKPGQPANSKKHSDLYTDENPKGTITGLKFATAEDARASVSKIRNSGRSHAHKIQAAVAMEQRAKAAGKAEAASVYRKYINATKKTEGVAEGRENYNGVNILFQKDDDEIFVKASAGGRELGHVLFVIDGDYLMPQDLEVEERYRGQGIAQIMYDYVKSKGYKIRRSGQQTDAGAGFWDKHKGQGQNVWEQGMAEAQLDEKCWDGYEQQGMKNKGGRQVPNCVPAESVNEMDKSQTPPGRDGSNDSDASKKEYTAKATTPKKVAKDAEKILNKELNKKQGMAEGSLEELANTSLKVKEPKDFVNTNDRKQVTYKVMKFKSGKDTYLINFTVKGAPAFGKKSNWNAVNVGFGVREEQDDYSFGDEMNTDLTAKNKNQFLIYSTVINAIRKFITEYNTEIDEIIMQGAGERQVMMYQRFFRVAPKYFPGWHHDGKYSLVRDVPRQTGKKVKEQGVAEEGERGRGRPMAGDWDPTSGKVGRVEKTPTGVRHHADPSRYGGTEPEHELDTLNKGQVSSMDKALGVKWDRESKRYFSPIKVDETKPKEKEADYGDDYQDMVARIKKLAGLGPLKTVYDPAKRVYRNIPTAQQPKK